MKIPTFGFMVFVLTMALAACAQPTAQPTLEAQLEEATPAQLFIFSNSSPHISVIDTKTNEIVRTADIPEFTSWTWNDDNNYYDGENLWLGLRDKDTNDAEVIALNLDNLEVVSRLPLGKEELNLYIGKAAADGILHVGKMDSAQLVTIDTKTFEVLDTWDVPVGEGGVVCDADIAVGPDGVERFYTPTRKSDLLISLNPVTGETIEIIEAPEGSTPHMLTTAPNGTVWVQEAGSNTNAVHDPVTLDLIKRFATGIGPVVASFSPDGKYGFIGHFGDTDLLVMNAETLDEVARIFIGNKPVKVAAHPDGTYVYTIVTKEASVAVIHTKFWKVTERISLDADPSGIFLRVGS